MSHRTFPCLSVRQPWADLIVDALKDVLPPFTATKEAINCHHNYVAIESHYGEQVFITRKGAIRAGEGELGIIPGSMGARSFIVRGKGNESSFCSCSHGAGRKMSRARAKWSINKLRASARFSWKGVSGANGLTRAICPDSTAWTGTSAPAPTRTISISSSLSEKDLGGF